MVIYFVSGYSSLRYEVCDIVTEGDKAVFKIMETTGSDAGDAEVAGWIITVAVPDEEAAEWNDYDVVSVDKI